MRLSYLDGRHSAADVVVCAGLLLHPPFQRMLPARPPIALSEGTVIVQNQTKQEWGKVVVTVKRISAQGPPRGPRRTAPRAAQSVPDGVRSALRSGRQSVAKIELTATDGDGKPISLKWTGGRVN